MSGSIEIEAAIRSYLRDAMSDTFDSGALVAYDATVLEILSPASLASRELSVFHDHPVAEDSVWRRLSHTVRFEIDEDALLRDDVIFTGAISNVRVVE